ncbi:hypothetical protein G6R40_02640 [Chryseobacterium sp. POL2]|uniref:hypothetical protein n=1 Tax=Chryseobacterium sp. POL2 TaxID=2713414 RepID=UPI0013E1BE55|nr:hypothetical protein [Chryseobacterium sp. POL2]QIG88628.1 hypothetical protein G6R40_02640 [Chryseobacterium sp. POL2]
MKFSLTFATLFIGTLNLIAQNFNVILQVNDQNINGEITNLYLSNNNQKTDEKIYANYYPGDLIVSNYDKEKFENLDEYFTLTFTYNTFKKGIQNLKTFNIKLQKKNLEQPYLIINVYDFRNRKYKKWFQYITKEDYLAQITFPNSGIYIRQK